MKFIRIVALQTALAYAAFVASMSARAQQAQESSAAKDALETITVTAQRRTQNNQDVPITISVLNSDTLASAGATQFHDIAMMISGVTINNTSPYVMPFIRGIGSVFAGPTAVSSVAVYIDDAYNARPLATAFELDNVQSVEVLKGPQATLYGRNATGGSINIHTKTTMPGAAFEGSATVTAADYDNRRYSVFASGTLFSSLAGNITAYSSRHNGWVKGLQPSVPGNVEFGGQNRANNDGESLDTEGVSGKLTWVPIDAFKISLGATYFTFNDTEGVGDREVDPSLTAHAFGLPLSFFAGVGKDATYVHDNYRDGSSLDTILNASYDSGNLRFVSVGSYSVVNQSTGAGRNRRTVIM